MAGDDAIPFDPAEIAKKEPGWDDSLERLVSRWIGEVAAELR